MAARPGRSYTDGAGRVAMGRSRGRFFRGRASYKASDVASLFLIGLVFGVTCYLILTALVWLFDRVLERL